MIGTSISLGVVVLFSVWIATCCTGAIVPRPPFVSHVNEKDVEWARAIARTNHDAAVEAALSHYPISTIEPDASFLDSVSFRECEIPGSHLPDFDDVLAHKIYVTDLLDQEECQHVIGLAEDYFQGNWTTQATGQYEVAGFLIREVPSVREWFLKVLRTKVFPLLEHQFPGFSADDLCVDHAYLFKYTPETGRRTDIHTDSGCLSMTISLNDDYDGGGTWFEGLENVVTMKAGQVTIRPGGLKHCGYPVTSGTRYIIGGFCIDRTKVETTRMLMVHTGPDRIRAVEVAVYLNPNCDAAYNFLAHEYELSGELAKARQVLEYCLQNVNPRSSEVAYSLSSMYMDQRLFKKAKECLDICLSADDADVDALMATAQCFAALGDTDMELSHLQRIVNIPGANPKVLSQAYCNLGVMHQAQESEIQYYLKALECYPQSFEARYSLACAWASQSEWTKAVEQFKLALENVRDQESRKKALQSLYTASVHLLRKTATLSSSQEGMIQKFQETMGADNFAELSGLAGI
jgi:tetratricopeptide (TPR) repeat protein